MFAIVLRISLYRLWYWNHRRKTSIVLPFQLIHICMKINERHELHRLAFWNKNLNINAPNFSRLNQLIFVFICILVVYQLCLIEIPFCDNCMFDAYAVKRVCSLQVERIIIEYTCVYIQCMYVWNKHLFISRSLNNRPNCVCNVCTVYINAVCVIKEFSVFTIRVVCIKNSWETYIKHAAK